MDFQSRMLEIIAKNYEKQKEMTVFQDPLE